MTRMVVRTVFCGLMLLGGTVANGQPSASASVPGTASPWLAGMPDGVACCVTDRSPGQSPVRVAMTVTPSSALTFRVSGLVTHDVGRPDLYAGPDGRTVESGGNAPIAPKDAENGVSSITAPLDALLGVFLDDSLPVSTAPPAGLDFSTPTARDFTTLSPSLKQVFFIGDGATSGGMAQTFIVPAGATRLFLGIMDGVQWINNGGSFSVTVEMKCKVDRCESGITDNCVDLHWDSHMSASFRPPAGLSLIEAAGACGFQGLNWLQLITFWPSPSNLFKASARNTPIVVPPGLPFYDAPLGGYTYQVDDRVRWEQRYRLPNFAGAYPFYFSPLDVSAGCASVPAVGPCLPIILGDRLNFSDTPYNHCLPSHPNYADGNKCVGVLDPVHPYMSFKTQLVGMVPCAASAPTCSSSGFAPSAPLFEWTWSSNFDGSSGSAFDVATMNVADPEPGSGNGGVTVTSINGSALVFAIASVALPAGNVGMKYSQPVLLSGGQPPYRWTIVAGRLPSGLTLSPTTGQVTGVPTNEASSVITVQATDSSNPPQTATKPIVLTVRAEFAISTTSLPIGRVGVPYSQVLQAVGGTPPLTWSLNPGTSLPSGLSLSSTTGEISGTPTGAVTNYRVLVRVTDSASPLAHSDTAAYLLTVK